MDKIKVKPATGLQVRDPHTKQPIPVTGIDVPQTTYWLRRIKSGDVVVVQEPTPKPQAKPAGQQKE